MERIRLTKEGKEALRRLSASDASEWSPAMRRQLGCACQELDRLGFANAYFSEEEGLVDAVITDVGANYILTNPRLCNPVGWDKIAAIAACITALAAVAALLVACLRL